MTERPAVPSPRGGGWTPTTPVEGYCDDLLLALRMEDVSGARIGAVLAEVRDHLAESGEDPVEVFGPAQEYAAAISHGTEPGRTWSLLRSRAGDVVPGAAMGAGVWWTVAGVRALVEGRDAVLTEAHVLLPLLVGVVGPLVLDWAVGRRRWWHLAAVAGGGAAALAALYALPGPLVAVALPAPAVLLAGLALVAVVVVQAARGADPVLDPLQDPRSARAVRHRDGRLIGALVAVPVLAGVALLVLVGSLAG